MGRSFSFVPNSPQEPCEADEYKHDLTKVVERDVHLASPPFGGLAARNATKEFSSWEEPSAWKLRADRLPFMADSRGETPQGYCSRDADRLQRFYVSLRCLLPSRLPARESYRKPALWPSLPSGSILLYPPPGLACWREKLCASHPLVSPAGSVGSRQSATGARSPPPMHSPCRRG